MAARRFLDDDDGYLGWKSIHPVGFVLNAEASPKPAYLVLHEASCPSLKTLRPNYTSWTHHYAKVCADSRAEVERWITDNVPGGIARDCQLCFG